MDVHLNRRDDFVAKAVPLNFSEAVQTQRLYNAYGHNSLNATNINVSMGVWKTYSETNDWYVFNNVAPVPGRAYRVAAIGVDDPAGIGHAFVYTNKATALKGTNFAAYTCTVADMERGISLVPTGTNYLQITKVTPNYVDQLAYNIVYTYGEISTIGLVLNTNAVVVAEGGTASVLVRLNEAPATNVTVNVQRLAGDADLHVASGASLTFTTNNWNVAQAVTLGAAQDTDNLHGTATFGITGVGGGATFTATEQDDDYAVTVNAANGTVGMNPDTDFYALGASVALTAQADAGYLFVGWGGDLTGLVNPTNLTVSANHTVTALFAKSTNALRYAVSGTNGVIEGDVSQEVARGENGSEVTAVATTPHYHFAGWSDGVTNATRTDVNVMADLDLTAYFAIDTYSVIYTTDGNGSISGSSTQTVAWAANGSNVLAQAHARYRFLSWDDGSVANPRAELNVTSNMLITALFELIPNELPRVTFASPVTNRVTITEGGSVTFKVTASDPTGPEAGMRSVTWLEDGVPKLAASNTAPNAITSTYTLRTTANTVQGVESRDIEVKAVAQDRLLGTTEVVWIVTVNNLKAAQTITFPALPIKALGDAPFAPGARASSRLEVSYSSSNPGVADYIGGLLQIFSAGTTVITASQPGNADFKPAASQSKTLTVKARLTTEALPQEGGSVTGEGLYSPGATVSLTARAKTGYTFLSWENGSQVANRKLVMPNENVTVQASFGRTTEIADPVVESVGAQQAMVGVAFNLAIRVDSESLPTATGTGLPAGLKAALDASGGTNATFVRITGIPTTATPTNAAPHQVQLLVRNAGNPQTPVSSTFTITVVPLPLWAQGAFSGSVDVGSDVGPASMVVTAKGGITGKFAFCGTNYSYRAASYSNGLEFSAIATAGRERVPLMMRVSQVPSEDGPALLSVAEGWLDGIDDGVPAITLYRSVWKDAGMAARLAPYVGYYTATLPGDGSYGSGYLGITVDAAGAVKSVGKLADGTAVTAVSMATALLVDETNRVFAVLHTAPATYKGGCFFGVAEFVKPDEGATNVFVRPLGTEAFIWRSRNPMASPEYDEGFERSPVITGGRYSSLINLNAYYTNGLSVGEVAMLPNLIATARVTYRNEATPPQTVVDIQTVDVEALAFVGGLPLSVMPAAGVGTGLRAPAAQTPTFSTTTGETNFHDLDNPSGLTINFTRATGLFKGGFNVYYDYISAEDLILDRLTYTRVKKAAVYEGMLTPVREDLLDGAEGRGFFLWADKSEYENAQGRIVPYSFNWSYDFTIEARRE